MVCCQTFSQSFGVIIRSTDQGFTSNLKNKKMTQKKKPFFALFIASPLKMHLSNLLQWPLGYYVYLFSPVSSFIELWETLKLYYNLAFQAKFTYIGIRAPAYGSTLISLINVALWLFFLGKYSRSYAVSKDPSFIFFLKKIIEKLGENRKKWLFSKASLYSVTKIPGPTLVPDPSFIRIREFYRPYGYLQSYIY